MIATVPLAATSAWSPGSAVPDVFERIFAAPSPLGEVDWDEENIFLSKKESSTSSGIYRSYVTPHARFIREQMGNPLLRQITIQKNDQSSITRHALNLICRIVAERPRNVLYVINSLEEARRMSARLRASLIACPATRDQVTEGQDHEDTELMTLTFNLRDMVIYFVGGGSIGGVANKQISVIIVDEADKIPRVAASQNTHVVDEAKSRFKSVPIGEGLIIVFSKPNQETDIVHTEYKLGTMRTGRMPCPHCGHRQEWVQQRLIFEHCKLPGGDYDKARVLKESFYRCERAGTPECGEGQIYDHHRGNATAHLEWVATNINPEPGHESFHVTDFCLNPEFFPDASLGRIALDLIEGIKKPVKNKAVQAARFGLPEMLQRAQLKEDDIYALRSNYVRGTVPRGMIYVGIYSDLQGIGPKWVKFGINRKEELFIIDWGTFLAIDDLMAEARLGVPEIDESQQMAPPQGESPAQYKPTGIILYPQNGGIDEGDEHAIVRSFVVRSGFFFLPTKGRGQVQQRGSLVSPSPRDHDGHKFEAYHFNDDQFKKALYLHRIRDHHKIIAGKSRVPRIHFPIDVDHQMAAEMTSEHLTIEKDPRGYQVEKWEKDGPNDFGDGVKGCLVMWHVLGPRVLEGLVAQEAAAQEAAAATPAAPKV
jgi:phage terminase large subunit GpA-like protein